MSKAYDNAKELNFINFDSANNRLNFGLPITSNGANISTDITVYGANSTSNTYFALPTGNLVSRPASPPLGAMRYNTTNDWPEIYTTNGWQAFAAQPYIISVSPSVIAGNSNAVIDIYGVNFGIEAQVYFIDNFNNAYLANTVTYYSNTHISAPTPRDFLVGVEPLDVKVVQNSGMYTLENAIDCGSVPTWVTTAGSLGSIFGANTVNVYVSATDAESSVTYSLTSGSLPGGLTFSSNGLVQGVATGVTATTTYNFTIKASDVATNNVDRAFSYQILNRVPVFNTASSLSTITDSMLDGYSANVSIDAYDPDGGVVTYAVTVGSVPTGFTLNTSNGALQLTDANTAERTTNTTSTFTVSATDIGSGVETRQFNITVEHPKDSDFSNTVLLLSATDSNTVLKDASSNNLNIIPFADARASNFSPYNTSWSFHFPNTLLNGNNQTYPNFITISNTNINLSGSNYTIETWIYPTTTPSGSPPQEGLSVLSWFGALDNRTWLAINPSNRLNWGYDSPPTAITGTSTIPLHQWTHVAVTWDGTTTRLFVNGIIEATSATNFARNLSTLYIGKAPYNSGTITDLMGWQGSISNLRIIKGTALYTANTTISSPLTVIANTVLLTANGNRFVDFSNNQLALSINGSTSVRGLSPFVETDSNTGSVYLDGTGDYVQSLTSNNSLAFGTGDFTIEFWNYGTASGRQDWTDFYDGNIANRIQFLFEGTNIGYYNNNTLKVGGARTPTLYSWNHYALSRNSGVSRVFINGQQHGSSVSDTVNYTGQPVSIGQGNSGTASQGYFADFRILNGTGLYTANFAPPTISSTNIANTKLLTLQNRQPHNNHGFQDSSNNKHLITRSGNTSLGTFTPFSADANSWSVLVPETPGEYIQYAANSNFNFGTGQYSVDAWVYIYGTSTSIGYGSKTIFSQGNNASNQLLGLSMDSTNRNLSWGGVGSYLNSYNNAMNRNEWTHVAVTRDASNVERMFINGKLVNSRVSSTNWGTFVNDYTTRIGCFYDSNYPGVYGISAYASQLAGYISNLRINIGSIPTELQTSSNTANAVIFVPPTSVVQDANTKLLMCRNNRHTDSSIYNWTPSAITSSIRVLPFSPFAPNAVYTTANTGGSAYFDGSDGLTAIPIENTINTLYTANGNFTMECWVYPLSFNGPQYSCPILNFGNGSSDDLLLRAMPTSASSTSLNIYAINSAGGAAIGASGTNGGTIYLNQWSHIVFTRESGVFNVWLNGTRVINITGSTTQIIRTTGNQCNIGRAFAGTNPFWNGYISGVKITNGAALYTGTTISVPSIPANVSVSSGYCGLLLPFNNSAILDYTGKNNFETVSTAKVSNNIVNYNLGSMFFNGSSDYIQIPDSEFFNYTGDFTIEFWMNPTATTPATQGRLYSHQQASVGTFLIAQHTTGAIRNTIQNSAGTTLLTQDTTVTPSAGVWTHVAYVRFGNVFTFYINGVANISTTAAITIPNMSNSVTIGANIASTPTAFYNGYLDDYRVTRTARYTANFTPRPRKLPRR